MSGPVAAPDTLTWNETYLTPSLAEVPIPINSTNDVLALYMDLTQSYNVLFCFLVAIGYVVVLSVIYFGISRCLLRSGRDYQTRIAALYFQSKLPIIVIALSSLMSLYSCGLFIYLVSEVEYLGATEKQSPYEISLLFCHPWIYWSEFAASLFILLEYTLNFSINKNKYDLNRF